jgi:hypothetical protein
VLVPRSSGTPVAAWAWPIWVVSRRHVLEAVFVLLEFSSPSRRIFLSAAIHSPLSGSPYRSFAGALDRSDRCNPWWVFARVNVRVTLQLSCVGAVSSLGQFGGR